VPTRRYRPRTSIARCTDDLGAIMALTHAGEPVDYVTFKRSCRSAARGDRARGAVLGDEHAVSANAQHYRRSFATSAAAKAHRGRVNRRDSYVATDDVVGLIDEAERKIIRSETTARSTRSRHCSVLLSEATSSKARETRGQFNGLETGYKSLDLILQACSPAA